MTFQKPVTKKQLAEYLGVAIRTLERWIASGELPAPHKIGKRRLFWAADVINQCLDARLGTTEAPPRRRGRPRKTV